MNTDIEVWASWLATSHTQLPQQLRRAPRASPPCQAVAARTPAPVETSARKQHTASTWNPCRSLQQDLGAGGTPRVVLSTFQTEHPVPHLNPYLVPTRPTQNPGEAKSVRVQRVRQSGMLLLVAHPKLAGREQSLGSPRSTVRPCSRGSAGVTPSTSRVGSLTAARRKRAAALPHSGSCSHRDRCGRASLDAAADACTNQPTQPGKGGRNKHC
jgi:hypothetical protein